MKFKDLLTEKNLTIYKLSKLSGIPRTTLFDIAYGISNIYECSGRILLKLSKGLNISIEELLNLEYLEYNPLFEQLIPEFLKQSIQELKRANPKNSHIDCLLDEVSSSINVCEIENLISHEQASYLRAKVLGR